MNTRPPALSLDAQSRVWVLLAAGACLLPLILQLPSLVALGLGAAAVLVVAASWRRPLPALVRWLLPLVLVGGVLAVSHFAFGRDTACALLAAMLAVKPAETFTLRDGRSLLGFALFAPFATFLLDQGPLSLLLGLIGSTLALAALLRLAELESGDGRHPRTAIQRLITIAKMMAIGLPLAFVVFWLFPRLATPLWGVPQRAMARPGLSDHMAPGEWVDLLNDDTTALRVQFSGATPPTSQMYWRGPVLWNFDGRTWTQARWLQGIPAAPMRPGASRWNYELELEPTDGHQLVALDLPTATPSGARLSIDYGLYSQQPLTALTRWTLHSAPPVEFQPRLQHTLRAMALALPPGYNPRTLALAQKWRRDAGGNDDAIVQRAMQMIRKDFAYTLATPLLGRNSVDEFLFDQKAGFCEHFSSAFVVLMRAAGIPARVVTGYVGGYRNPIGSYWQVRRSDAHAWAEVWLAGRGWVRVDPTAAVAPDRIYDTLADRAPGADALLGAWVPAPIFNAGDWLRRGWNDFALGFDAARQRNLLRPLGLNNLDSGRLIGLFSGMAVLALLWMAWLTARVEREPNPVLRAWHRLDRRYARIGLGRFAHEPAARWAERVSLALPHAAPQLYELSWRFNNWRYASGQPGREAVALVKSIRQHRPVR
ncbi:MAG: transglutaminase-like superfamily protein [Xanthomonadaceae bacterium]|nr:transglutaminase-like superfamily protein [Xanthomonadaceae bacterium]